MENLNNNQDNEFAEENLVNKVVNGIQIEIGQEISRNPRMSTLEIKLLAQHRFIDLLDRGLLSEEEANRCYQRFAHQVDYYYDCT